MGLLDAARHLVWPASTPRFSLRVADDAAKMQATWPSVLQNSGPVALAGAVPAAGWESALWTVLGGDTRHLDLAWDYEAFYRAQPWVFSIANKLIRGIGRLPLKTYRLDANGDRTRLRADASPLAALLASPWPRATPTAFKQRAMGDLCLYGNALFLKVAARPTDVPASLEPLPPHGWRLADGRYAFAHPTTGAETRYDPWQIIHFRHWAPAGPGTPAGFACSPIEPLRKTCTILDAASRLGIAAFRNGGNPPGYLTTDAKLAEVEKAVKRIALEWAQRHGGADNAYRTPVLTDGLTWHSMGGTLNDAAVVDHHRLGREEVCAVYDVPPPVAQILDNATFSNITEQGRWLVQHTYNVWTTLIEETIAVQLIADVPALAGQFVEFDTNEILKGDPQARFTAYGQAINAGILTQNEARAAENWPRIADEDADTLHRPLSLSPAPAEPAPAM